MSGVTISPHQWDTLLFYLKRIDARIAPTGEPSPAPDTVPNPAAGLTFQIADKMGIPNFPQRRIAAMVNADEAAAIQAFKDLGAREERERIIKLIDGGVTVPLYFSTGASFMNWDYATQRVRLSKEFLRAVLEPKP